MNKLPKTILFLSLFIFSVTSYGQKTRLIVNLNQNLDESSGLAIVNDKLITINDSGNESELYQFDTSDGKVLATFKLMGAKNIDWEDLATDDSTLYIGDFGNNNGNRRNLEIYSVAKKDLKDSIYSYKRHRFVYSNQTNFSSNNRKTKFDCEAFIVQGDSFILFTKDWVSKKTYLYTLHKNHISDTAYLRDSFNVNGLITSACVYNNKVLLLGYNLIPYSGFIWEIGTQKAYFNNTKTQTILDLTGYEQIESIVSTNNNIYFSSESQISNAAFYQYYKKTSSNNIIINQNLYRIYPNPVQEEYLWINGFERGYILRIESIDGKEILSHKIQSNKEKMEWKNIESKIVIIRVFNSNNQEIYITKIIKK